MGLEGGHLETNGITPQQTTIEVPLHRHNVEIDIYRAELSLSRIFDNDLDFQLRIPWFRKDQVATIDFIDEATAEEQAAAIRNGEVHHRTANYEGLGDAELSIGWRTYGVLFPKDTVRISAGTTIPLGETEPNPWILGDNAEEHLHIQFGNGTFDPIFDAYYGLAFDDTWAASVFTKAKLPFYENSHGYRGSIEATLAPKLNYRPNSRLSLSAGPTATYLGRSHWSETGTDPNSGAVLIYASLGVGYIFGDALTASFNLQLPLYTHLLGEEDGLESAPVIGISISRQF